MFLFWFSICSVFRFSLYFLFWLFVLFYNVNIFFPINKTRQTLLLTWVRCPHTNSPTWWTLQEYLYGYTMLTLPSIIIPWKYCCLSSYVLSLHMGRKSKNQFCPARSGLHLETQLSLPGHWTLDSWLSFKQVNCMTGED